MQVTYNPVTIYANEPFLGLRLPTGVWDGLTAQEAAQRFRYCNDYNEFLDARPTDLTYELTYRGQVVLYHSLHSIGVSNQHLIASLLRRITTDGRVEVMLPAPRPSAASCLDTVLENLERKGLGGVHSSDQWRIGWARDPYFKHPWDVAYVHLLHGTVEDRRPSIPYFKGYQKPECLSGRGTLREQFESLALFSLETGYLMHYQVSLTGQSAEDGDYWATTLNSWDLGLVGYAVEASRNSVPWSDIDSDRDPTAYILRRLERPEKIVIEATIEEKRSDLEPCDDKYGIANYWFDHRSAILEALQ